MTIPDSGAVRAKRHRLHKAGDHSLCHRCDAKRGGGSSSLTVVPPAPETVFDPRCALRTLAERLESAHVADPSDAAVARELRMTLLALTGSGDGRGSGDSDLAELFEAFSGT